MTSKDKLRFLELGKIVFGLMKIDGDYCNDSCPFKKEDDNFFYAECLIFEYAGESVLSYSGRMFKRHPDCIRLVGNKEKT